jgi:hypothetical protein
VSNMPIQYRFMPPNATVKQTIVVNGRTYSAMPGVVVDVPVMDAGVLSANGWCMVAGSGTTAQRPANPSFGQQYHDTTLGITIIHEGVSWRNPATGAVA